MTIVITDGAGRKLYFPEDNMDVLDYEPLEGRELIATKCGHVFAKATLQDDWMGNWKKTACPVCNGHLDLKEIKKVELPKPAPIPTPEPAPVPAPAPAPKIKVKPSNIQTATKTSNIFHSVIKAAIPLTLIAMAIGLFVCQIISSFSKKK